MSHLDLEADRFAGADDKFVRPEGNFREVNLRSCRVPHQLRQHGAVATSWREDYSLRKTIRPTISV